MNKLISNEIYSKIDYAKKISTIHPKKAYELSNDALMMSISHNLKVEEGYALISLAFACRANSDINKMLEFSYQALDIFEDYKIIPGQIKAMNLIGISYFYNSMYEEALKYFIQVEELLKYSKDDYLLSSVLNNIGEVYRESLNFEKAFEFFRKALLISTENDYKLNAAGILSNIGEIYYENDKYEEAYENFKKSYHILINEQDMVYLGEIESKLGKVYYKLENMNKAEELLFSSLQRLEALNNKYYSIDVLIYIAKLYSNKNPQNYLYYLEKAMQYAEITNAKKKLCTIYKYFSEYYETNNEYKISLEYYKNYNRLNVEIMDSTLKNKLEIIKIELEHTKEIDRYEKIRNRLENEITSQKNKIQKMIKSNEELTRKAYEDELTSIPNRRCINDYLNKIWDKSNPNDFIALYMIDIDHFKKYNDYWGHSNGDICLKRVSECIKNIQIKRNDVFGRYGGEEFVYIAENIDYSEALKLGEYIRTEVEKLGIVYLSNNEEQYITISVGIAIGRISDFNYIENLFLIADKYLYQAKELGRNKTCIINISE